MFNFLLPRSGMGKLFSVEVHIGISLELDCNLKSIKKHKYKVCLLITFNDCNKDVYHEPMILDLVSALLI